jgi:hypothetical protein
MLSNQEQNPASDSCGFFGHLFTTQERLLLREENLGKGLDEIRLLRILILRIFALLPGEGETTNLNDAIKLYTLLVRFLSLLGTFLRLHVYLAHGEDDETTRALFSALQEIEEDEI